jgi:hypothetical protein
MHRTGGTWLTNWTPEKVATAPDPVVAFAEYAQQRLGVPWPTQKDLNILRAKIGEFFRHYNKVTYYTLCRVVDWCRARRRRFGRVWMVIGEFRNAFAAGALPELEPDATDERVEARITVALTSETQPAWRARLIGAEGRTARTRAVQDWERLRGAGGIH